jgi:putative membrane protein
MQRSTENMEDSADRRTQLAADRTVFAAERTYVAWVRTGLVSLASGIGAKNVSHTSLPRPRKASGSMQRANRNACARR